MIVYHHWNFLCSSQVKQVICVAHGVLCRYVINDKVRLVFSLSQDDTSFGSKPMLVHAVFILVCLLLLLKQFIIKNVIYCRWPCDQVNDIIRLLNLCILGHKEEKKSILLSAKNTCYIAFELLRLQKTQSFFFILAQNYRKRISSHSCKPTAVPISTQSVEIGVDFIHTWSMIARTFKTTDRLWASHFRGEPVAIFIWDLDLPIRISKCSLYFGWKSFYPPGNRQHSSRKVFILDCVLLLNWAQGS